MRLGVTAPASLTRVRRWPRGMPQYLLGHPQRVARIEANCNKYAGLYLAGNAFHGVGLPDCIASGERAADAAEAEPVVTVASHLAEYARTKWAQWEPTTRRNAQRDLSRAVIYLVADDAPELTATERLHLALMLTLTFTTGINDAVGYLGLDKVVTGNMTGKAAPATGCDDSR